MIIVNLDIMMARRKISLGELAEKIDITPANLSILKTGKKWSAVPNIRLTPKRFLCLSGMNWHTCL